MHGRLKSVLLYSIFFVSGVCGLGYQMVWSRMFGLGLGHEVPGMLAVVAAFFGGMALGAWGLDGRVSQSRSPGRWYGFLEIVIGSWALLLIALLPRVNRLALHLIGLEPSPIRHWLVAFILPFFVLLPATAAMGSTFPAMDRFVAPTGTDRRSIGTLYALNTSGAVIGILAGAFLLLPRFGFSKTLATFAMTNLLCGATALVLQRPISIPSTRSVKKPIRSHYLSRNRLSITLFFTGLLGIGYEALGVRALSQVLENTIYTFAATLAVYLLGTSLGAGLYQRFGRRIERRGLFTFLLWGLSSSCALGIWLLSRSEATYRTSREMFGETPLGVLAAEMIVGITVFGLPTLFMGATFSHLVQAAREENGGVGRASGINTIGSAIAPLLFGVLLLSLIGIKWSLVAVAFGYLLLLPNISGLGWLGLVLPIALVSVLPAQIEPPQIPQGGKLIAYREGIMDSIAVVEHFDGNRSLRVNNRFNMGGTGAANPERRHAHIPLLLHPNPRQALFLGVGTGISLGAFAEHAGLRTDGVELVPEIIDVLPQFEPHNKAPAHHPQLKLHVADARRFVRTTTNHYDVVVADLFHPARDGAGALYTREHFQAIRDALAPRGLFCQWLPLFQLDDRMLRVILRTFLDVFPSTQAYLLRPNVDTPVVGLIGTLESVKYPSNWFEERVRDTKLSESLKAVNLNDGFQLFGCWIAGPGALRDFAQNAPLSRDDLPVVMFEAPRLAYQRYGTAYGTLLAFLEWSAARPAEPPLQGGSAADPFRSDLLDYIGARDIYIRGLVAETKGNLSNAIDLYVGSARRSRHFSTGYAHCLTLAMQRAKTDPERARKLLQRLVEARPDRPIAEQLLKRLNEE